MRHSGREIVPVLLRNVLKSTHGFVCDGETWPPRRWLKMLSFENFSLHIFLCLFSPYFLFFSGFFFFFLRVDLPLFVFHFFLFLFSLFFFYCRETHHACYHHRARLKIPSPPLSSLRVTKELYSRGRRVLRDDPPPLAFSSRLCIS